MDLQAQAERFGPFFLVVFLGIFLGIFLVDFLTAQTPLAGIMINGHEVTDPHNAQPG